MLHLVIKVNEEGGGGAGVCINACVRVCVYGRVFLV